MLTSYEFASAWLQARCKTDRGASLVEYALLVALIAVVCIAAVTQLGSDTSDSHQEAADGLAAEGDPGCPDGSHRGVEGNVAPHTAESANMCYSDTITNQWGRATSGISNPQA